MDKYRWTYGRKWRPIRMRDSTIKLPVNLKGEIDWEFMENYIKSLPYSKCLESVYTRGEPVSKNQGLQKTLIDF